MAWTDAKIAALGFKDLGEKADRRLSIERGLYIRLRRGLAAGKPTLSKRWEYRSKVGKRGRWLALGEYPGVSYADARKKLDELKPKADKARKGEGEHPALVARAERRRNLSEPTLKEVADEWLSMADLRDSTKALHRGNLKVDVFDRVGDGKIKHLTKASYLDCIDAPKKRGARGQASQVYKSLRTLINYALERGYLDADPLANVANPKPYNPRKVTPRAADDHELREFLKIVAASKISEPIKQSIEFQLLTGARPGEVRGAQWAEINKTRHIWRIPAERSKNNKSFDVHLSPQALALLERAEKIDSPNGYIFTGLREGMVSKLATARALTALRAIEGTEDRTAPPP